MLFVLETLSPAGAGEEKHFSEKSHQISRGFSLIYIFSCVGAIADMVGGDDGARSPTFPPL